MRCPYASRRRHNRDVEGPLVEIAISRTSTVVLRAGFGRTPQRILTLVANFAGQLGWSTPTVMSGGQLRLSTLRQHNLRSPPMPGETAGVAAELTACMGHWTGVFQLAASVDRRTVSALGRPSSYHPCRVCASAELRNFQLLGTPRAKRPDSPDMGPHSTESGPRLGGLRPNSIGIGVSSVDFGHSGVANLGRCQRNPPESAYARIDFERVWPRSVEFAGNLATIAPPNSSQLWAEIVPNLAQDVGPSREDVG